MKKADRDFLNARLVTTVNNLRKAGLLSADESIVIDSTDIDRRPYSLELRQVGDDGGRRIVRRLVDATDRAGLTAAIDMAYELSWLAVR